MAGVHFVFSVIVFTLIFVTPTPALPSNIHQIKSHEDKWLVPRANPQQKNMPGMDYISYLASRYPRSSSSIGELYAWLLHRSGLRYGKLMGSFLPALPIPNTGIQCGTQDTTLQISSMGSSPLLVDQSEPWLSDLCCRLPFWYLHFHLFPDGAWMTLLHKLPQCNSATRHRRQICDFSQTVYELISLLNWAATCFSCIIFFMVTGFPSCLSCEGCRNFTDGWLPISPTQSYSSVFTRPADTTCRCLSRQPKDQGCVSCVLSPGPPC